MNGGNPQKIDLHLWDRILFLKSNEAERPLEADFERGRDLGGWGVSCRRHSTISSTDEPGRAG